MAVSKYALFLALISILLAACQPVPAATPAAEPLQVAASFSLLADVVEQIAGQSVTSLVPLGENPRTFVPSSETIDALAGFDVVFVVGASYERGLTRALMTAEGAVNKVVVSKYVGILPVLGAEINTSVMPDMSMEEMNRMMCQGEGETAEACLDYYNAIDRLHSGRYDHTHEMGIGLLYTLDCAELGICDPYVWGDPHNVMLWSTVIRDTLTALDPDNAAIYAANTEAYLEELLLLIHDEMKPAVKSLPETGRVLVTTYPSLRYFAKPLQFQLVPVPLSGDKWGMDDVELIRDSAVPAIFADEVSRALAADAGVERHTLYVESLGAPDGPAGTYLDYMRYNLKTIVEALGGTQKMME